MGDDSSRKGYTLVMLGIELRASHIPGMKSKPLEYLPAPLPPKKLWGLIYGFLVNTKEILIKVLNLKDIESASFKIYPPNQKYFGFGLLLVMP